jgi:hypothetical protein
VYGQHHWEVEAVSCRQLGVMVVVVVVMVVMAVVVVVVVAVAVVVLQMQTGVVVEQMNQMAGAEGEAAAGNILQADELYNLVDTR